MSITASSTKAFGARAVQKPDPTAVVAKTEADHHTKAESLRRTNEKIDAIEQCIAADIGPEVDIRQRIAESQQVINEMRRKKAELNKIILQEKDLVEKGEKEMKKSKDQRRENHSVELGQLVEEQAEKLKDLRPAERALHIELGEKIHGYMKRVPCARSSYYKDEADDSDGFDDSDDYYDEPFTLCSAREAPTNGQSAATIPKAVVYSKMKMGRPRPAEVVTQKPSKSSKKAAINFKD